MVARSRGSSVRRLGCSPSVGKNVSAATVLPVTCATRSMKRRRLISPRLNSACRSRIWRSILIVLQDRRNLNLGSEDTSARVVQGPTRAEGAAPQEVVEDVKHPTPSVGTCQATGNGGGQLAANRDTHGLPTTRSESVAVRQSSTTSGLGQSKCWRERSRRGECTGLYCQQVIALHG